jgi:hypothetical protein
VDTAARCGAAQSCAGLPDRIEWVVSRSGMATTATTRPAYPIINGALGAASTGTAAMQGADGKPTPCDCTLTVLKGTSRYCAHDAARATVTLCRTTQ